MRIRFVSLAILLIAQLSIAQEPNAASKTKEAATSNAMVYFYRYKQFVGSGLEPSVYCDEAQLARMDNGRYFAVNVDPGKHSFRSNDPQSGLELDAKAGESYFVRVEIATGFMKGHGRLMLVSPEQGSYELNSSKLKPLDLGKVVDKTRVSVAEAHPAAPVAHAQPTAPAQPAPRLVSAPVEEHTVSGFTVSDPDRVLGTSSVAGDQDSLGDVARRNREKKQQPPK